MDLQFYSDVWFFKALFSMSSHLILSAPEQQCLGFALVVFVVAVVIPQSIINRAWATDTQV